MTVAATALRPGDLIEVRAGDVVSADARLLAVRDLEVDESSLTGESMAVDKQVTATPGADLADRACMVYEGTTVLAGTGRTVVVAVGGGTEAGRALAVVTGDAPPAGVQAGLEELTRWVLGRGAAVTGLVLLRLRRVRNAVASGVGIAVTAVPEGLPLVGTVAQLAAARRLSRRGVLVPSSRTVEALRRVDTVCFDKTGTLTEGRLRLARVADLADEWDPADQAVRRVLRAAARACLRTAGGQPVTHATDQAILDAAEHLHRDAGDADWANLAELAFESSRGYSAGLGRTRGSLQLVKGAPEVLLPGCTRALSGGSPRPGRGDGVGQLADASGSTLTPFDGPVRAAAHLRVERLARQGLRVLAVARRGRGRHLDAAEEEDR